MVLKYIRAKERSSCDVFHKSLWHEDKMTVAHLVDTIYFMESLLKKKQFKKAYLLYGWKSYLDGIPIILECLLSGCKDAARAMVLVSWFNGVKNTP